jgi:hypothetical protein
MRKNELISISTLSPGGRQSYVKPTINVLEMGIETCLLTGSNTRAGIISVKGWEADTNMGSTEPVTDSDQ